MSFPTSSSSSSSVIQKGRGMSDVDYSDAKGREKSNYDSVPTNDAGQPQRCCCLFYLSGCF
jgi:hypothetical protein